jgi:hypothetical protein
MESGKRAGANKPTLVCEPMLWLFCSEKYHQGCSWEMNSLALFSFRDRMYAFCNILFYLVSSPPATPECAETLGE